MHLGGGGGSSVYDIFSSIVGAKYEVEIIKECPREWKMEGEKDLREKCLPNIALRWNEKKIRILFLTALELNAYILLVFHYFFKINIWTVSRIIYLFI